VDHGSAAHHQPPESEAVERYALSTGSPMVALIAVPCVKSGSGKSAEGPRAAGGKRCGRGNREWRPHRYAAPQQLLVQPAQDRAGRRFGRDAAFQLHLAEAPDAEYGEEAPWTGNGRLDQQGGGTQPS
jgi:hypothetical protein